MVRLRARLLERLDGFPVVVDDVGSGPADALIVAQHATEDVRASLGAGIRWIQSLGTGVETVLIPEVVESDIVVTNSAGASAAPVAEFAFARILEHAKGLPRAAAQQREHIFDPFMNAGLEDATLCVIGLGAIGRRVAALGKAFRMNVLGVRRRPEMGPEGCDAVFGPHELDRVMGRSDYGVGAAAQTPDTQGLLGRDVLERTKPGCFIVNVGRPGLVDNEALVEVVRAGRISAALDVLPQEPLPPDSPLWNTPGIAVSSHIAVLTPRVLDTILELVLENVQRFVEGRPLLNVVDKQLGYVSSRSRA